VGSDGSVVLCEVHQIRKQWPDSPALAAAKAWARLSRGQQVLRWLRKPVAGIGSDHAIAADALEAIPHLLELIDDKGPAASCHKCSDVIDRLHQMLRKANLIASKMERVCDAFDETDPERAAEDAEGAARVLNEMRDYLDIHVRGPRFLLERIKQTHPLGQLAERYLVDLSDPELLGLTGVLGGLGSGGELSRAAMVTAEFARKLGTALRDREAG
jgi:hypothetical protein